MDVSRLTSEEKDNLIIHMDKELKCLLVALGKSDQEKEKALEMVTSLEYSLNRMALEMEELRDALDSVESEFRKYP